MERAILSSEIAGIDIRGAVARRVGAQGIELSEKVRRMKESIPQVIVLLEAAVDKCTSFTGSSEADELILALDDAMLQYIYNLQETLKSLRSVCGVDNIAFNSERKEGARIMDMVSEEEEWSIVQGALQILTVADCLTSRAFVSTVDFLYRLDVWLIDNRLHRGKWNLPINSRLTEHLIRDDDKLILLAFLSDSLEYLADSIERFRESFVRPQTCTEDNSHTYPIHRHSRTISALTKNLATLADDYRRLATDCLKVLRLEMQLETIFHTQEIYGELCMRSDYAQE